MHLMCSICLETFNEPKALPCLHNFCKQCLQDHISNVKLTESGKSDYFECPLCRKKTYPNKPETHRDCWASEFLTNHFIVSIIDESKKIPIRGPITEKQNATCVPCEIDGKQEPSSCYCLSCSEYLCRACQKDHKRFKMTRKHTVIEEEQYPNNTVIFRDIACLKQCKEHSDHEVQFKCMSHNTFICSVCATTIHKKCEPVQHIDDLSKDMTSDWEINKTKLESLKESLNALITRKLAETEIFDHKLKAIGSTIPALQESLRHIVDVLQRDVLDRYIESAKAEETKLSSEIAQCIGAIDILRKAKDFVDIIQQHNLNKQQAIYLKSLNNEAEKIKQLLYKLTLEKNDETVDLIRDNLIERKTMISEWMDKVGNLELTVKDQHNDACSFPKDGSSDKGIPTAMHKQNISIDFSTEKEKESSVKQKLAAITKSKGPEKYLTSLDVSTYRAQKLSDVNIKIPGGSNAVCSHTECVLLKNGNVIFLDHTNRLVKMLDAKLRYRCHVTLKHGPVDVLIMQMDRIAVSTSYAISVFVFSSTKLQKLNDFLFKEYHILLSICTHGDNLAILQKYKSDDKTNFIQVRTTGNKIVRDIASFTDMFSKPFKFSKPSMIRSTRALEKDIVICDETKLLKNNKHGKRIATFEQEDLKSVSHCVLDPMDNIFVADKIGGNIFIVPADMSSKARLLIKDLPSVSAIELDTANNQLIVCFLNNDNVSIYQLS